MFDFRVIDGGRLKAGLQVRTWRIGSKFLDFRWCRTALMSGVCCSYSPWLLGRFLTGLPSIFAAIRPKETRAICPNIDGTPFRTNKSWRCAWYYCNGHLLDFFLRWILARRGLGSSGLGQAMGTLSIDKKNYCRNIYSTRRPAI